MIDFKTRFLFVVVGFFSLYDDLNVKMSFLFKDKAIIQHEKPWNVNSERQIPITGEISDDMKLGPWITFEGKTFSTT